MSTDTGNRRIHSTGKGSPYPHRLCKVMPRAVSGEIILAGGCGISRKTLHSRDTDLLGPVEWNPRFRSLTTIKNDYGLESSGSGSDHSASHRHKAGEGQLVADVRLRRHGEFLCTCSDMFPEEENPEYRYTRWEEIPGSLINRQWLCPNFFEIREAMEQLDEPDKEWFFDWCDKCHHDISSEDPHLLVAHYLELYGNATSTGDDTCPDGDDDGFLYYPGISNNYFDTVTPRFEVFDDNYD